MSICLIRRAPEVAPFFSLVYLCLNSLFMTPEYPLQFTLDDRTEVTVNRSGSHLYDFTLNPEQGAARHFTYNDEEEFTDEKEAALDFDQLNALRRFWLETRDED
jgi:hypothetical protein